MLITWIFITTLFSTHAKSDLYVGSTPCDAEIKSMLNIPASLKCEFMKWQLRLSRHTTGTFDLTVSYGESKPNTNGFINGGTSMTIKGSMSREGKVITLQGEKTTLTLLQIDNNILHFADRNKKLLTGNGGWGYVLNKTP
jgi:hypothetical protein